MLVKQYSPTSMRNAYYLYFFIGCNYYGLPLYKYYFCCEERHGTLRSIVIAGIGKIA
jgi:hypothetical protein